MPSMLPITDKDRARRHVLGQQLYRLRQRYHHLKDGGLEISAEVVIRRIKELSEEYDHLGGKPVHRGNLL